MARETLRSFLSSRTFPKENPRAAVSYTVDGIAEFGDSSGLGFDRNSGVPLIGFDAADSDIGLIGGFLEYIADEEGNFYKFHPGNTEGVVSGKRGEHLQDAEDFIVSIPGDADIRNRGPFAGQGTLLDAELSKYSNSGYFDDPDTGTPEDPNDELFSIINKVDGSQALGSGPNAPRTANDLLKGVFVPVEAGDPEDFVVQASVSALKRNNRFNMEVEEKYGNAQNAVGIDAKDTINIVRDDADNITTLDALKDAAASLLIRASGYSPDDDALSVSPNNRDNYISETESLIIAGEREEDIETPGLRGRGKINVEKIHARNATGMPTLDTGLSVRIGKGVNTPTGIDGDNNGNTFGVTYNNSIRSTDNTKATRVKTAIRMIAMFQIIKEAYELVISNLHKTESIGIEDSIKSIATSPDTIHAGAEILGLSRKSTKFVANNFLFNNFLTPTDFGYTECFLRGVEVIFGEENIGFASTEDASKHINNTYNSPAFWTAIASTVMKKTFQFSDKIQRAAALDSSDPDGSRQAVRELIEDAGSAARIANIFAIIGEKSLHHTNAAQNVGPTERIQKYRDPDSLDDIPGNRVGKSRKKNKKSGSGLNANGARLGSETTLAWEQGAVPGAYLLPLNIMRAAADLNNSKTGANPARGMLGSRMVRNTYTGLDTDGTGARIPNRVVKILEDRLGAEYVPFYFHDLRTNEIISFHAFLNQLTDSITPSYNKTQGYGRLDPVQTYQNTTRNLQVGFTVYATNKQDFDEMWYKINKLVTLLYPQWTSGTIVQTGEVDEKKDIGFSFDFASIGGLKGARFVQPFTQTIGASPVIRLRIGDIIKSNYSRFGLARTFGIGDQGVIAQPIDEINLMNAFRGTFRKIRDIGITVLAAVFGSPQGLIQVASDAIDGTDIPGLAKSAANAGLDLAASALSEILINGYVNPLLSTQILNRLRDPNQFGDTGFTKGNGLVFINPNMIKGYRAIDKPGRTYFTSKRLLGDVKKEKKIKFLDENGIEQTRTMYVVEVVDPSDSNIQGEKILVRHDEIWNDPNETFTKSVAGILFMAVGLDAVGLSNTLLGKVIKTKTGAAATAASIGDAIVGMFLENPESQFMRPENNPFAKAFESTKGRGLAGVMGGISFNWLEDFPWETDFNSRAPIGCTITFNFDVIHDLPPGLDHTGYNRAPLYNVGEIMRNVADDPYSERFPAEERIFRKGGSQNLEPGTTVKKTGKK